EGGSRASGARQAFALARVPDDRRQPRWIDERHRARPHRPRSQSWARRDRHLGPRAARAAARWREVLDQAVGRARCAARSGARACEPAARGRLEEDTREGTISAKNTSKRITSVDNAMTLP